MVKLFSNMTGVLTKRTKLHIDTDIHKDYMNRHLWRRQTCESGSENSNYTATSQRIMLPPQRSLRAGEVGRDKEGSCPRRFKKDTAQSSPGFGVSNLHNCDTINFCCSKPPRLWYSITEALGN